MKLRPTPDPYGAMEQSGAFYLLVGGIGYDAEKGASIRDEITRRVNLHDALIKVINQIPNECHCSALYTCLRCEADAALAAVSKTQKGD